MCIVVDTNCLASVFKKKSVNHEEFKPVLDWILEGKGSFVIGGTKYLKENIAYLDVFEELKKWNKVKTINQQNVDQQEVWASTQIQDPDFDDQHLIALLRVSGCKLICSLDERAYPFFKHEIFFSPAAKRPKIYNQKGNATLFTDSNIAECCISSKLTVKAKETLTFT